MYIHFPIILRFVAENEHRVGQILVTRGNYANEALTGPGWALKKRKKKFLAEKNSQNFADYHPSVVNLDKGSKFFFSFQ
jgi:hypothetical protein